MTQLRLIATAVIFSVLVAFGVYVNHLRTQAAAYESARMALADANARHASYVRNVEADRAARDQAEEGYVHEITTLRAAAARPVPAVRLCASSAPASVPAAEAPAASAGGHAAAPGLLPAGTAADSGIGRDIGPDLARLADAADELSARYRAALTYWEPSDG